MAAQTGANRLPIVLEMVEPDGFKFDVKSETFIEDILDAYLKAMGE